MWVRSLGREDPLEEGMAMHSSIVAWRISWTGELGGLQSIEPPRVGHDWSDLTRVRAHNTHTHTHTQSYSLCGWLVRPMVFSWGWIGTPRGCLTLLRYLWFSYLGNGLAPGIYWIEPIDAVKHAIIWDAPVTKLSMLKPQRAEIETPWLGIFQPLGMEASAEAAVAGEAWGLLQSEPVHPRLRSQASFLVRAILGTLTFNRQGCLNSCFSKWPRSHPDWPTTDRNHIGTICLHGHLKD